MLLASPMNAPTPRLLGLGAIQLMGNLAGSPPLMCLGGGNPAVTGLQNSLKALAQVTGRVGIDPGAADGIVGTKTMMAIITGFNILAEKLPSEAKTALQIGLIVGGMTPQAKELVTRFASQLDMAAKAATLKYAGQPAPAPAPPTPATGSGAGAGAGAYPSPTASAAVAWIKTPIGMASVAVGVLGAGVLIWSLVK